MQIVREIPASAASPIALTIGNFDGVHLGHQAMLARLKQAADARGITPCAMIFEPHPREYFSPNDAPARLTSLREKITLLSHYGVRRVYICRFDRSLAQMSAEDFIADALLRMATKWVLVGEDFRFGARRSGDLAQLQAAAIRHGFEVAPMPSIAVDGLRVSSSDIRQALADGELTRAAALLGRHYSICGRVVHGDKLGARIGYPTANIELKRNKPALSGIFAIEVDGIGTERCPGVASLGVRPTIKTGAAPLLEVHLFGSNDLYGNLYGKRLTVHFLHKLRDEEHFADLDALTRQIGLDVKNAQAWFSHAAA
ncbi:MAG: bifunctional riboflavin kinase/FAD synthetase [Burkholderiales bacterium]|nr:bifunctional riboflavin kinase/FAD synthetase [Burkholderiales bacterium]MDQ3194800.1 bifunctional riboflavin kinase/FAD synthetase [Pseudomonadota bacterium]